VAVRVEAGELAAAQLVQDRGVRVAGVGTPEGGLGCLRRAPLRTQGVDGRFTSICVSTGRSSEAETRQVASAFSAHWRASSG
jgi:hypothetical protein